MKRPWELGNEFTSLLKLHYLCRLKHYRAPLRCTRFKNRKDLMHALEAAASFESDEEGESWATWVQAWFKKPRAKKDTIYLNDSTILCLFNKYFLAVEKKIAHSTCGCCACVWHACGMIQILLLFIQSYPKEPEHLTEESIRRAKAYIEYFEKIEKKSPRIKDTIIDLRQAFDFETETPREENTIDNAKTRIRRISKLSKSGKRFVVIFNVSHLHTFMVEFSHGGYCTLFQSWINIFSQGWWLERLDTQTKDREKFCTNSKSVMYQQANKIENNELTMCDATFKKARNIFGRGAMFPADVLFAALDEICDVMWGFDDTVSPRKNSKKMRDLCGACPMSILASNDGKWTLDHAFLKTITIMMKDQDGRESKMNEMQRAEQNRKTINPMKILGRIMSR